MRQAQTELTLAPRGQGLHEFTDEVRAWVRAQTTGDGLLTLFLRHTSASLLIQENADPDVSRDLMDIFKKLAPEDTVLYRHVTEGPDDMPAHIRAALTQTQLSIPVHAGAPVLGTWQGIFLFEHRTAPQRRRVALHLLCD
ncbi:MAG: YjbQ family protein [Alphaproteobacteria bacterium]|jgi:secondary thiamine-phosphate synthase enzyme|nr:YjbQ family protein [Alphaproteobacteria bacterium]